MWRGEISIGDDYLSAHNAMTASLDATGVHCPEPVLRTAKAMRNVRPGETLTVLATDPVATIDFPYYCHHAGLELVSTTRRLDVLVFEIRKPARPVPLMPNRPIG
jgi:tRNA 2-thiouridine synthesizing protein A